MLVNEVKGNLIKVTAEHGIYRGKHKKAPSTEKSSGAASTGDAKEQKEGEPSKKMTSFSNESGAKFTSYSFTQDKKDTAVGTTGDAGATTYGPQPKPTSAATSSDTTKEQPEDLEIVTLVAPRSIVGYDLVWQVATESSGSVVVEAAALLLQQVHHRLDHPLQPQIAEFDNMYIEKCFDLIRTQKEALDKRTEEEQKAAYDELNNLSDRATRV